MTGHDLNIVIAASASEPREEVSAPSILGLFVATL
jgi:hypothetical protein